MSGPAIHRAGDPAYFEVKDAVCGNEHRIFLAGELDLLTGPLLEEMVGRVCATRATNTITLDLSEVTFMDSTGLGAVLHAQELCREGRFEFRLKSPQRQVQRLFEVAGVIDHLPLDRPQGPTG
jgi:anti-sigma B factor antagonist